MACTFDYTTPATGGWGVVKMVMLVPESFQLFVCPFACGRHGSIGAAEAGLKDRLSYLFIDQTDIIDGYEDLIVQAVPEYLEAIEPARPRVLFIFVSCLDDLIGTNHAAVLKRLRAAVPDVEFAFGHMNPISLASKSPPAVTAQRTMYGVLKKSGPAEKAVNLIGNLDDIDPSSELISFLGAYGYVTRHISRYTSYDKYQEMARSSLNLVLDPKGLGAAKDMEKKLGIPFAFLPVSYSLDSIARDHETLGAKLGLGPFAFTPFREEAEAAVADTLRLLDGYPVAVDSSAFMRPYSLASALTDYGFNVVAVFAPDPSGPDRAGYEALLEKRPGIKIINPQGIRGIYDRGYMEECVALGSEAAYLTGSLHPGRLNWDAGMHGYRALTLLMKEIRKAYLGHADLKAIIKDQRLVI